MLSLLAATSGCGTVGYYSQAIGGHFRLMRARQPIDDLLADKKLDSELRQKLETLVSARKFGIAELGLPDNDSYSSYAATGQRAVTFNVVAADEFSVQPRTWCFPVAGCVSYRGYFDEEDAKGYAEKLASENADVTVGGASAYSTLGWFDDPILDTMLRGGDLRYVGTLFHELAHQVLYVKNDSNFNEAYASFVEQTGVRRWLTARGEADRIAVYDASQARGAQFAQLLKQTREQLQSLYAEELAADVMRKRKKDVFARMRASYDTLKVEWNGYKGYDGWFSRELNNARLVAVSTYRRYVPAFAAMYDEAGADMLAFHDLARSVSELDSEERQSRMDAYLLDQQAANNATSTDKADLQ
ncbi:MAG: aminopeptidase [Granulosicoccus sp.]